MEQLDFLVGGGGIGRWRQMGEEAVRAPTVVSNASAKLRRVSSVLPIGESSRREHRIDRAHPAGGGKMVDPGGGVWQGVAMSDRETRKRLIVSGALRADGLIPSPYVEEAQGLGLLTSDLKPTPEWERVKHCILGTVSGETRDRYQRWCNMGKPRQFVEPKPIQADGPLRLPITRLLDLPIAEETRFEAAAVEGRYRSGVAFVRDGQPLDEAEIVWL